MKTVLILLIFSFLSYASYAEDRKESPLFRALGYASFLSKSGDFLSTDYALGGQTQELNPLMQNRNIRLATTIAVPALTNFATSKVYQHHPKLALFTRLALTSAWSYATLHNLRQR